MTASLRPKFIPLLVTALFAFASLKLTGVVVGVSTADAQTPSADGSSETAAVADTAVQSVLAPELAPGEVERRILERLATRRQELDAREDDLKLREAVVVAAELKLERAFEAFEQERAEIAALRAERDAASTEEVEALVSAYERMKGRDAAAIFNALDEEIMLAVASNMRTQALAAVLAEMDPEKARKLTVLLAERARIVQHDAGAPAGR